MESGKLPISAGGSIAVQKTDGKTDDDDDGSVQRLSSTMVVTRLFYISRPYVRLRFGILHDSQVNETFQQPGRWHDVILTPTPRPVGEPLSHIMSFTLKRLESGSVYEAIVQAKNRYGWNEVSLCVRLSVCLSDWLCGVVFRVFECEYVSLL